MVHTTWHYVTRRLPGVGVVLTLYDANDEVIDEIIEDTWDQAVEKAKELAEEGGAVLVGIASDIANATLDMIRGLGSAILDGLDAAYDAAAEKLDGREPAVISGLTVATIGLLTAVFLYNAAKSGRV